MMGYAINEKQSKLLEAALEKLSVEAEADSAFMMDYGGNILAYVSPTEDESMQTVAALAAGSFAATRELAGMIGETGFQSILHKGDESSMYMHNVADNFLILVIFGSLTTPGLVRLYVEKTGNEIDPILEEVANQSLSSMGGDAPAFELNDGAIF